MAPAAAPASAPAAAPPTTPAACGGAGAGATAVGGEDAAGAARAAAGPEAAGALAWSAGPGAGGRVGPACGRPRRWTTARVTPAVAGVGRTGGCGCSSGGAWTACGGSGRAALLTFQLPTMMSGGTAVAAARFT